MKRLLLVLAAASAGSCGLISSDVTHFQLGIPEKPFTVDTADWKLDVSGQFPAIPCSADCSAATAQVCSMGTCTADCDGTNCQAHVALSMRQMFNLAVESPELQTIDDQAAISVTVDAISFRVDENTLNVATPPLTVYLAPIDVVDSSDSRAQAVGTIVSVPPGVATPYVGQVDLTAEGRQVMKSYMENFRTPFNVIIAGRVDIRAGDPVPDGRLVGVVAVKAHAGL